MIRIDTSSSEKARKAHARRRRRFDDLIEELRWVKNDVIAIERKFEELTDDLACQPDDTRLSDVG